MYLSEVKIKNFRGYGENPNRSDHYYIFDELDSPLVVFHGFNGHGKTSFFEAIEWCLTDTVARLERLYKADHGGAYTANDLNRSHYLKFSASVSNQRRRPVEEREVVVELLFDNGTQVIRRSNSRVLSISDSSDYDSSLEFIEKGKEPKNISNNELLEYFATRSNDGSSFIRAHVLAQEGITDFVRKTSPDERKSLFMRYLQQEGLSDHIARLRLYLNGGNVLSRKKTEHEGKKTELNSQQQQINGFLQNIGYADFESYKTQFHVLFVQLLPFVKRASRFSNLSINLLMHEGVFEATDYSKLLQSAAQVYERAVTEKGKLQARHAELQTIRDHVKSLDFLYQAEQWIRKSNHARSLKDGDIEGLQKTTEEIERHKLLVEQSKRASADQLSKVIGFEQMFDSISDQIDNTNKNINLNVWKAIRDGFDRLRLFEQEFQEIIEQEGLSIPVHDEEKLSYLQTHFISLDGERQQIADNIRSTNEKKNSLSSLNSQYKHMLNQVKEYIQNHTESITSCPVCLNEDFTSARYNNELGLQPESSISINITSIIDKTVSNGDKVLEALSDEAALLNSKIVELNSSIAIEVIVPLISWLQSVREKFLACYREVKSTIEKQQRESRTLENQLIERGRDAEELWERLRESTRVLFGDDVELKNIKVEALDNLWVSKSRWFEGNLQKIGFEYEPNLEEITSKILLIRNEKEVADYYPNNLVQLDENQISNKRNFLMIELLIKRLDDLLKLRVPGEYNDFFSRYEQLDAAIRQHTEKIDLIDTYQQQVRLKHSELVTKQNQILGDQLHGHPVIAWVYSAINPHTQYKDLKVIVDHQGTHFTSEEIQNNLYLDQIFSQAQLNILALSTFIGIGLTQQYSSLDQLFLDDPIQSMDDVNVLAFIDVLRAVLNSETNKKRFIISTHDDNFAELLAVKMRNKNVLQYFIEGYGPEGPVVRKHD
ncbi:AAA family ATPase [Paenibacillus validus]|uniref:Nuclease SbcCD subunit C n=1 Tax=Paenibacillus validus TaxID=44253 RepID=A0A7X3CUM7_9BACL|nr:AAA family ATPase [Paenibacillus validus]MUG74035.1 AAA family ATPase [Paenibacillus validus]